MARVGRLGTREYPTVPTREPQHPDGHRDLDATFGVKKSHGTEDDGKPWPYVIKWFGYKVHVLVDVFHGTVLAWKVTQASRSDVREVLPLVQQLEEPQLEIASRAKTLTGDRGYDSGKVNETLHEERGIKPIIDTRKTWKDEATRPLFPDRADSFINTAIGLLHLAGATNFAKVTRSCANDSRTALRLIGV